MVREVIFVSKKPLNATEQAKEKDSLNLGANIPKGVKKPKMTMK